MTLTREAVLAANDLKTEPVAVPEWGGQINVRSLTGAERDDYEQGLVRSRGPDPDANLKNVRAQLIVAAAVDDAGQKLFEAEDVEALGRKSARALNRVWEAASRLNGIGDDAVAELAKN